MKTSIKKRQLYMSGPLFNPSERILKSALTAVFEENDFVVFLPHRDGLLLVNELANGKPKEQASSEIYKSDINKVLSSDGIIAVLDGRVPDEGMCVELGAAFGANKPSYGLKTDVRGLSPLVDLNPMFKGLRLVTANVPKLVQRVSRELTEKDADLGAVRKQFMEAWQNASVKEWKSHLEAVHA